MNNNKTVVPGIGNAFGFERPANQGTQQPTQNYNGTHFPGMNVNPANNAPSADTTHKPIMGFLYSVSRIGIGEYWPLYMGLNTIGRATNCSVRLSEATISDNHAEIVIRQMKNPDNILVSIQDARSTCGTLLNGSSLGFDAHECHNGDIITIGEHYELFFILIDTRSLGLKVREDFIPVGLEGQTVGQPRGQMGGYSGMPAGVTIPYGQPSGHPYTQVPGNSDGNQQQRSTIIMPGIKK